MKVLLTDYYSYRRSWGAEISAYSLAIGLKRLGMDVSIASTEEFHGIRTYLFSKYPRYPYYFWRRYLTSYLSSLIEREKIEIVHAQEKNTTLGAILAARRAGIPVVVQVRDFGFCCPLSTLITKSERRRCDGCNPIKLLSCCPLEYPLQFYKYISLRSFQKALRTVDAITVASRCLGESLRTRGVDTEIHFIPNPVDLHHFASSTRRRSKRRYGPDGNVVITYVGYLDYSKGILGLTNQIIPKVCKKVGNVHFLIVGEDYLNGRAYRSVQRHGLGRSVTFLGKVPYSKMPEVYAASDIIISPSLQESFGRTAIEAMASAKPFVASNIEAFRELVEHGDCGFLVDPLDFDAWSMYLNLLINDAELRRKMGRRGRELARERYDLPVVAEEVLNVYEEIV